MSLTVFARLWDILVIFDMSYLDLTIRSLVSSHIVEISIEIIIHFCNLLVLIALIANNTLLTKNT